MQRKLRRDDNGKWYMLSFNHKGIKKAQQEKERFYKDIKQGKITVVVIKKKLALTLSQIKSICKKQNIVFVEDKIFTADEYSLIKTYVMNERNKNLKK